MDKPIIVIATQNKGKIEEFNALFSGEPVRLMGLADFGPMPEPVEDADTFEDNAYLKAVHYARVLGFPALADDSGLAVNALDGAPGVYSARWAGPDATDADRCRQLLSKLESVQDRRAAFVCALVLAVPSGPGLTWVGRCEGDITREPAGENGFGYDPIFYYAPFGKTFAQLSREEKNQVSHRGRALAEFKSELPKVLTWLNHREQEMKPPHPH